MSEVETMRPARCCHDIGQGVSFSSIPDYLTRIIIVSFCLKETICAAYNLKSLPFSAVLLCLKSFFLCLKKTIRTTFKL